MAEEDQTERSQQSAASDEDKETQTQTSPSVIEIHDSTTECEEEVRPNLLQMDEKSFVSSLHSFMKERGSPIERIPHLGFKQINLWMIYKAVEKMGGYDSVTVRRLWKKVYDELGGSPGSTSAATCTRRHYERLVLPFERHIKGEADKPLPLRKPRKPYKRNLDGKINKAEGKGRQTQFHGQIGAERSPETVCRSEVGMHPPSSLWTAADEHLPDCGQPNPATTQLCTPVYACSRLLQVPAPSPWTAHTLSAAGEVISPLEKKKRLAQASLNLPSEDRPSVIHSSQSPTWASTAQRRNSSDGSPIPSSSPSSRSPSPYSISSEDSPTGRDNKASGSELTPNGSSAVGHTSGSGEDESVGRSQISKDSARPNEDVSHISSHIPTVVKDSAWNSPQKGDAKMFPRPFHSSLTVKSDWAPTSASSFTKVIPKSGQLPRPAPVRPGCKVQHGALLHQNNSVTCIKKPKNTSPWLYQAERREKSRTMLQKPPPSQQNLLPVSYVMSGGYSPHQPQVHPAFLPNRMRLPQSQLMYHQVPVSPAPSAVYPYPYAFPLWAPHRAYSLPAVNPVYPHKL